MKILRWSITIPPEKQSDFIEYSKNILEPTWRKFGCIKYELLKIDNQPIVPKQIIISNQFIEQLYFPDDFNLSSFFQNVKSDPDAEKISQQYEKQFNASEIELNVLNTLS